MNYLTTREEWDHYGQELFRLMGEGKLKIRVHDIYPLHDVGRAHDVSLPAYDSSMKSTKVRESGHREQNHCWQIITETLVSIGDISPGRSVAFEFRFLSTSLLLDFVFQYLVFLLNSIIHLLLSCCTLYISLLLPHW